jgi:hypothetical protein
LEQRTILLYQLCNTEETNNYKHRDPPLPGLVERIVCTPATVLSYQLCSKEEIYNTSPEIHHCQDWYRE